MCTCVRKLVFLKNLSEQSEPATCRPRTMCMCGTHVVSISYPHPYELDDAAGPPFYPID